MTFRVYDATRYKPRLRMHNGFWICCGGLARGWGPTYQIAYQDWKKQTDMWAKMHGCQE